MGINCGVQFLYIKLWSYRYNFVITMLVLKIHIRTDTYACRLRNYVAIPHSEMSNAYISFEF